MIATLPAEPTVRELQRENAILRGQISAAKVTAIQLASARRTLQKHGLLGTDAAPAAAAGMFLDRLDLQLLVRSLSALARAGQVKIGQDGQEDAAMPCRIVPLDQSPAFRAMMELLSTKGDSR